MALSRSMRHLSDEAVVLVAPFRGYATLLEEAPASPRRALVRRLAVTLGTVGVVGSIATAGRLVAAHIVWIAVAWIFVPVIHALTVAATLRACPKKLPPTRAIELHMAGNGPYLAFFFALALVIVASSDVARSFGWLVESLVLPLAGALTLFGGAVTSYAFYRVCGAASVRRALGLLVAEWAVKVLLCLAWYAFIDNLAPQFLGARAGS